MHVQITNPTRSAVKTAGRVYASKRVYGKKYIDCRAGCTPTYCNADPGILLDKLHPKSVCQSHTGDDAHEVLVQHQM